MELICINSNSNGNCYILKSQDEALIIECGVNIDKIKQALNFDLSAVVGCILTHEHQDHSSSIKKILEAGIDTYASLGTHTALHTIEKHRAKVMGPRKTYKIGQFEVMPFEINHDAEEPFGFLINHIETGMVLFLTDTSHCNFKFPGLNNIILETNYCEDIIEQKLKSDGSNLFLRNRVLKSHMSVQTAEELLKSNDLSAVNNIVLIHLSDSNSDEIGFRTRIERTTGKMVHVAGPNLRIEFNKQFNKYNYDKNRN